MGHFPVSELLPHLQHVAHERPNCPDCEVVAQCRGLVLASLGTDLAPLAELLGQGMAPRTRAWLALG